MRSVVGNDPPFLCGNALFLYHLGVTRFDEGGKLLHGAVKKQFVIIHQFTITGKEHVGRKHLIGLHDILLNEVHVLTEMDKTGPAEIGDV